MVSGGSLGGSGVLLVASFGSSWVASRISFVLFVVFFNFILPLRGPALTEGRKESTSDFFGARRGAPGAKKGSWHYVFNENHEFS